MHRLKSFRPDGMKKGLHGGSVNFKILFLLVDGYFYCALSIQLSESFSFFLLDQIPWDA